MDREKKKKHSCHSLKHLSEAVSANSFNMKSYLYNCSQYCESQSTTTAKPNCLHLEGNQTLERLRSPQQQSLYIDITDTLTVTGLKE